MPPSWGTGSRIPGAIEITRGNFEEIETLIRSFRRGSREFDAVMNVAVELMAKTAQGFVQRKMRGPVVSPALARRQLSTFQIPVRRVTGRTLEGWRVRRIRSGVWEVFNEERGAWAVEFGVVRGGHGHRRPVLKMSGVAMLRFIQRTRFGQRIMADTFGNLKNNHGQFRSFQARMSGSSLLGMSGPSGRLS